MSYRNKTYVAFASENIGYYRLMEAWRENDKIDFNFFDAHDLFISRDTSKPETIKANLRRRMENAKQIVLLGSADARRKGGDGASFLAHEVKVAQELDLPIVVAHLDGSRNGNVADVPQPLIDVKYHIMSVSFQVKIIAYALDNYAAKYTANKTSGHKIYSAATYTSLGL